MKRHLEPSDAARAANERFLQRRDELRREIESDAVHGGVRMAKALTHITDDWVRELWRAAADDGLDASLTGLGGYGRSELCFGSDVDLVIEVEVGAESDGPLLEAVRRFMAWARLTRVKLAHSVRNVEQASEAFAGDFRTAVSYLDARSVVGTPQTSVADAIDVLRADDEGVGFVGVLLDGYRERLRRYGQTIYLLEPDVKSGKGGLRDVHVARWAALVRRPEETWTRRESAALLEGHDWLLELRTRLHIIHGRKHDRLHFADQEKLAEQLVEHADDRSRAAETLMRRHYQVTRTIAKLAERAIRRWGPSALRIERRIDDVFSIRGGQVHLAEGVELSADDVFEALRLASEYDALLHPSTEEQIEAAVVSWGVDERRDATLGALLRGLLTDEETSRRTSTRLLELGILPTLVPEFEPVICHVQHDVYHVYTTDVHLLNCLEFARDLLCDTLEDSSRWRPFSEIAAQIEDRTVFLLAALFHDIGKNRGGGHSEKGAAMMLHIGPRLGLDPRQTNLLSFLVREHLVLSHAARRHDISDRRVVRDLAVRIRTVEALNQLMALTFCDMSTVGGNVMTDWDATLLLQLYQRLRAAIEHGIEEAWRQIASEVEDVRARMVEQVSDAARADVDAFVRDLPSTYLVESRPEALMRAFEAWREGARGEVVVVMTPDSDRGSTEVIVGAPNIRGALARITGAISSLGLNILDARIVTTSSNRLLDIFKVAQSGGASHALTDAEQRAVTDPHRLSRLRDRLLAVLRGEESAEDLLRKRIAEKRLAPKPTPEVDSLVEELPDMSDDYTVLQVKAPDRIGLLYEIARTLSDCSIEIRLSKIDSVGTQVVDTFYVETLEGEKLDAEGVERVCAALRDVVGHPTLPVGDD